MKNNESHTYICIDNHIIIILIIATETIAFFFFLRVIRTRWKLVVTYACNVGYACEYCIHMYVAPRLVPGFFSFFIIVTTTTILYINIYVCLCMGVHVIPWFPTAVDRYEYRKKHFITSSSQRPSRFGRVGPVDVCKKNISRFRRRTRRNTAYTVFALRDPRPEIQSHGRSNAV